MRRFHVAVRILVLTLLAVSVAVLGGCGGIAPAGFSGDVDVLLARGETYATYLASLPADALTDDQVLSLGYLERARLGLGSPFRLIDFALRDPDLPPERREVLAYALLAQVLQGRVYEVDPGVLALIRLSGIPPREHVGAQQLELIERAIAAAPTAHSGERAVRLGYRLAEAERTVEEAPLSVVAHAAALVADRRRAREDAVVLLRTAARYGSDPLDLLQRWRAELRFRVEGPAMTTPSVREEEWEARDGPQLALAVRTLAQRLGAPGSLVDADRPPQDLTERSLLTPESAARLRELALRRDAPPQAPVAVALSINRESFLSRPTLEDWQRALRQRFTEEAWNEERLAAGSVLLRAAGAGEGFRLPLIKMQSAAFLRAWNQEEPWFPGDPAPAAKDLEARFGLAEVEFAPEVREGWRPFYLRMLARGLADLERVLPTASVRGMRIRVGPLPTEGRALALHDPRTRTLVLPPLTGAGTLAHEVAHDLDWQLARKRYNLRGGYATDLAVRGQRGDRIAASLSGLAASLLRTAPDSVTKPHETRPAEIFARGTDWFVAAMLAREGRVGGYLTSFQDASLTGYGTTRGPDIGGGAVPNLIAILDEIAPVVERSRDWALEQYGPARTLSAMELAGAVLGAGQELRPYERMEAIDRARSRSLTSLNSPSCRLSSAEGLRLLVTAQRGLIQASTRAALRGAAVDEVRALAAETLGPESRPAVDAWLARRLHGAPVPVDSVVQELEPAFEDILYRAGALERDDPVEIGASFGPGGTTALCGSNPFASAPVRASARPRAAGSAAVPRAPARLPASVQWSLTPWHAER